MSKFEVGDRVQMPGIPLTVEVLELGVCEDADDWDDCGGGELFRFKDPGGNGDDWAHTGDFEKVSAR